MKSASPNSNRLTMRRPSSILLARRHPTPAHVRQKASATSRGTKRERRLRPTSSSLYARLGVAAFACATASVVLQWRWASMMTGRKVRSQPRPQKLPIPDGEQPSKRLLGRVPLGGESAARAMGRTDEGTTIIDDRGGGRSTNSSSSGPTPTGEVGGAILNADVGQSLADEERSPSIIEPDEKRTRRSRRRRHHAIIVPYRDRPHHLEQFLRHMGPYIERNFPRDGDVTVSFSLYIVEQADSALFNRGWLGNVGLSEIVKRAGEEEVECITMHDVDLVPVVDGVPYGDCDRPTLLGAQLSHHNNSVPYPKFAGGVLTMNLTHWRRVNGFSNRYEGWGGEDDDLFHRIRRSALVENSTGLLVRPPPGRGVFKALSLEPEHHPTNARGRVQWAANVRSVKRMGQEDGDDHLTEGLLDVSYEVLERTVEGPGDDDVQPTASGFRTVQHLTVLPGLPVAGGGGGGLASAATGGGGTPQTLHHRGSTPPPLEYVHIPYATEGLAGGGVDWGLFAIETAAAEAGVSWGACRYPEELEEDLRRLSLGNDTIRLVCPEEASSSASSRSSNRRYQNRTNDGERNGQQRSGREQRSNDHREPQDGEHQVKSEEKKTRHHEEEERLATNRHDRNNRMENMMGAIKPWQMPPCFLHFYSGGKSTIEKGQKTFAVVRNPYDRAVSAYRVIERGRRREERQQRQSQLRRHPSGNDRHQQGHQQQQRSVVEERSLAAEAVNMNEVIQRLLHQHPMHGGDDGPLGMPQHRYVFDVKGFRLVDFVLRHESLERDFAILMKQMGMQHVQFPPMKAARQQQIPHPPSSEAMPGVADLTNETVQLIQERFREDFKHFGYANKL